MNKIEQKVFDYAQSVEWDYEKVREFINVFDFEEWVVLEGEHAHRKATNFIEKYKPKDDVSWDRIDSEIPNIDHSCKDADSSIFGYKPVKDIKLSDFFPNPAMVTLPIEDYNHLRILELKHEIKKLKKELKSITK